MTTPSTLDRTALTSRTFSVVRRGFSPAEVTAFLRTLADRLDAPVAGADDPRPAAEEQAHRIVAEAEREASARLAPREPPPAAAGDAVALQRWLAASGTPPDPAVTFTRSPHAWASAILDAASAEARTVVTDARAQVAPASSDDGAGLDAHESALVEVAEAQAIAMLTHARDQAARLTAAADEAAALARAQAADDAAATRAEADLAAEARREAAERDHAHAVAEAVEAQRRAEATVSAATDAATQTDERARDQVRTRATEALAQARHGLEAIQRDEHATVATLRRVHDLVSQALPSTGSATPTIGPGGAAHDG